MFLFSRTSCRLCRRPLAYVAAMTTSSVVKTTVSTPVSHLELLANVHSQAEVQNSPALLHRTFTDQPHSVTHAKGSYLFLSDGSKVLDACGGAAVAILGHGNPEVIAAATEQMQQVSYIHTGAYTTKSAEDLAQVLVETSRDKHDLEKAYLTGSGSEANEAALKAARQYFVEKGELQRCHYVSRKQSYHGNTMGAMAISSNPTRKAPYQAILPTNVSFVSPAFPYQYQKTAETEEEYTERLVSEIREEFERIGPEKVISFIAEPVVGATSGCVAAPKGYFKAVRHLCDEYGILLHLDEVMCGIGRTGTYFAFEQEDVSPDIVTIGKGLGGGYIPVSAMLLNKKVTTVLRNGTSAFNHGQTFQAHPVASASALAVQTIVRRDCLVERCAELSKILESLLREAFSESTYVGDIRGRGLFWALEFVQDQATKAPFEHNVAFSSRVHKAAFELGVAVYPGSGTVDGHKGDHVLLAPPLTISEEELTSLVSTLKKAYDMVEETVVI